jgi:hypothetical protein
MLYAGLASDEEMIEHFKEHKAEFEEIVKRYRENNQTEWDNNSITKELLKNLGIYQINPICDTDYYKCIWLQNPYLIETAKKIESFTEYEKIHLLTKYGMIRVELMPRHKYWNSNLYYRAIRKDLYHIPEIPRLKNGKLLYPFNAIGQYSFNITILTSLNYISPKWQDKCVLKQIDSQWFLRACTAKRGNSGFITLWL